MAFNTKSIVKDLNAKPVPQCYNPATDAYEVLQGTNGANRVMVYDVNGNSVDIAALVTNIIAAINAERDRRGLAANKPAANTVEPGTTYWSTDTDPHGDAIEVSNGTAWVVI